MFNASRSIASRSRFKGSIAARSMFKRLATEPVEVQCFAFKVQCWAFKCSMLRVQGSMLRVQCSNVRLFDCSNVLLFKASRSKVQLLRVQCSKSWPLSLSKCNASRTRFKSPFVSSSDFFSKILLP